MISKLADRIAALCHGSWFPFSLLTLTVSITIVLPISIGGLHASGDLGVYLSFAQEIRAAIDSGDYFPGWANDSFGFGSLGIRFYPPVAQYSSALISMLSNNWYVTIWIYFFMWMLIGCFGVWQFVREQGKPVEATAAGILYAIVPFPLAEIYQFSLYAEFAAGSIIPFCLLFVTRTCNRRRWRDSIYLAIFLSLLILTHIPSTIITGISLLVYIPFLIERRFAKQTILRLGTSAAIASLGVSYYLVRLISEVQWVAHFDDKYSTGMAGYTMWLFPMSLLNRNLPAYYAPVYRNLDATIVITVSLLIPFFIVFVSKRRHAGKNGDHAERALAVTAAMTFFMLTELSSFIWAHLTLLQKIQFPWRWLTVLSLLATISFVLSLPRLISSFSNFKSVIALGVVGLIVTMVAYDVRQSFAKPNRVSSLEFEEVMNTRDNPAGTSFAAWWPVWAKSEAFEKKNERVFAGVRTVEILDWERESRHFTVGQGEPTQMRVGTFYYPYWKASINGNVVEVEKDENGVIVLPANEQNLDVKLFFEEPIRNRVALWLSILTWVLQLVFLSYILTSRLRGHDIEKTVSS